MLPIIKAQSCDAALHQTVDMDHQKGCEVCHSPASSRQLEEALQSISDAGVQCLKNKYVDLAWATHHILKSQGSKIHWRISSRKQNPAGYLSPVCAELRGCATLSVHPKDLCWFVKDFHTSVSTRSTSLQLSTLNKPGWGC